MVRMILSFCAINVTSATLATAQVSADIQAVDALIIDANRQILEMESALDEAETRLSVWETQLSRASVRTVERTTVAEPTADSLTALGAEIADHSSVAFAHGTCRDDLLAMGQPALRSSALNRIPYALACAEELSPRVRIDAPLECASLFWADNGRAGITLTGHVQNEADLAELQERFGPVLTQDVITRPFPVCSALEALELPLTSQNKPTIHMLAGRSQIAFNESLAFEVVTPDFYAFVYLVYLQADGTVVNLLPRRGLIRTQHPPRSVLRFGDGLEGRQTYTAAAPAGTEAIISIASRSPIEALEALEQGASGQYSQQDALGRQFDQTAFLDLLNKSIDVEFAAGAGQREISAEVLHLTVVPG